MKKILKKLNPKYCRVCGLEQLTYPWGADGTKPSFEICACCGVEFGNDDSTPTAVRRAREKWMTAKYVWADPTRKPHDWKPEAQLSCLKETQWDPWA